MSAPDPFASAATSPIFTAVPAPFGVEYVHVTPLSVLTAKPQLVPTYTRALLVGSIEMPNAEGSVRSATVAQQPKGGVAEAGWVHVVPPSMLTLIPASDDARPSKKEVA